MDLSLFLTIVAAAIGFFLIFRKLRSHQENKEFDSTSSPSSPPSSLSSSTSSPPSTLSISSASPSSSSHVWINDVFPSFRGEDVRDNFLSHIKKEFERKTITFFNDNGIKRGESIGPELIQGIRGSKIAVVLLSTNYASSKWCLEELVEIMKCREELGQTVIAIFYKVDPSHVKKLTGDFGKVFRNTCKGQAKEDIWRWKQALEKVATIVGYHSSNWDNEASMVEGIATNVLNELIHSVPSSDFEGIVGMRGLMEKLKLFILSGSDEVRMLGIVGPSGIGKSTIARFLFSQYSHEFPFSVFMKNIKRHYPMLWHDEYNEKLELQEEFLSKIVNHENISIHNLEVAQHRLKDRKLFIVLDDVDKLAQLDAVAKETCMFGPGSVIIITTQDKKLLNAHGVKHIYKVEFPLEDEALEIFCIYAFGQKFPYEGFEKLASEVTQLAGKLPLGLKIMGYYLKGMTKEEWEQELPRLRTSLDEEIESTLKFGYDALGKEDKDLFLYIACFFNYERIEKVEEHLKRNFSNVKQGLRVLTDKSLISIRWGRIEMHDLLARFGREIVRRQSIQDPAQRQFLVDNKDICQVLDNDSIGSKSVIGISFRYSEIHDELNISERHDSAFEKFSSLQFLSAYRNRNRDDDIPKNAIQKSLNSLPGKVRLLHWEDFPMTCMPSNFNPEFLVELNMPYSKLENLWDGVKTIRYLKWMRLDYSTNLKELPDLSTATSLLVLSTSACSSLVKLPFSIGSAINLLELDCSDCSSLVELPTSLENATNLQILDLRRCLNLVKFPSLGNATKLEKLNLSGCLNLAGLPSSLGNATNLGDLKFENCSSLMELPFSVIDTSTLHRNIFSGCSSLVALPFFIGNATTLVEFNLKGCSSLGELPSSIGDLTNLKWLYLNECSSLVELPSSIGNLTNLANFYLNGCSSLVELPSSIGNLTNLKTMYLSECSSLVKLPSSISDLTNLEKLYLNGCSSLVELPLSIGNITSLETLDLRGCLSLLELPSSMENLHYLVFLRLSNCSSLVEVPSFLGNLTYLKNLELMNCSSLVKLPSFVNNHFGRTELDYGGCSSLVEFPSSIWNATKMERLNLSGCSSLVELPSFTGNDIRLKRLNLSGCSSLVELPSSIGNAIYLKELNLSGCSSLLELSSSIGNAINLYDLNLSGCSSLVELPFSIGNITRLGKLDLSGCSSLLEIPSSIGNLAHLYALSLKGCTKIETLPVNISVYELDLTDCFLLKKFPNVSSKISVLKLTGTAIEEIPSSITSCLYLDLHISYWENLKGFPHAFGCIKEMHVSDTRTQEISPCVMEMYRLEKLVVKGCTKLVSLPELPSSLDFLDAQNCESLERLHCSFGRTKLLNFANCFSLNQEARDLIIKTSSYESAILPGEEVPAYFTYRATGNSVSMELNGFDTRFDTDFKACVLLVDKGCTEVGDWNKLEVSHCMTGKQNGFSAKCRSENINPSPRLKKHLYVLEFLQAVSSSELVFEFQVNDDKWDIVECGIRLDD
ncbi:disease resistance protein TAO1-like [Raphanus sativus]|uniref:ADP-ribosyl cyclase/cyclic ADP-ribose hydrolase n=1 Tax=Raphanus sativus TaxID=3726 RepID=A0A6J0NHS1_RAPSA|nr:disease resistance protein TAO1-like [Raphanus sativus]